MGIWKTLAAIALVYIGTTAGQLFAEGQSPIGCARELNPQPSNTADSKGHKDILLAAHRNSQEGFYFYSGDQSLFVPFQSSAIKASKTGSVAVEFQLPLSNRTVRLLLSLRDPRNPQSLGEQPAPQSAKTTKISQVEVAEDEASKDVLDAFLGQVIAAHAAGIGRSPSGLGLSDEASLYAYLTGLGVKIPDFRQLGLNNVRFQAEIRKLQQDPKYKQLPKEVIAKSLARSLAQTYTKKQAGPSLVETAVKINSIAIDTLSAQLKRSCLVGKKTSTAAISAILKLRHDVQNNNGYILSRINTEVQNGLQDFLEKAILAGYTDPAQLKYGVANFVTLKVDDLRDQAEKKVSQAGYPSHAGSPASGPTNSPATH